MIERRTKRRFDVRLGCEIVHLATGLRTRGWTKNLSSSGVLFTCEERVSVGDAIDYLIMFPRFRRSRRDIHLHCAGTVVREDLGLAFAASLDRYEFVRVTRAAPKIPVTD
jgi:hypothetical protein